VGRGELGAGDAAAWAHERQQVFSFGSELDVPTFRALVELQERLA
jgi:hypothetical protein